MTLRVAQVVALAVLGIVFAISPGGASAHSAPCHRQHTCPSDHHSYVWHDAGGHGWDCARPGAPEVTSADTKAIAYGGYTYLCHAAGAAAPSSPGESTLLGPRTKLSSCKAVRGLPDRRCTPGAVFVAATAAKVCVGGYASAVRNMPESVKQAVYREYGISTRRPGQYQVDHLVSLELGGSNEIANLWPEPAAPPPGFHEKDALEDYLHHEVCSGRVGLAVAQRGIAANWVALYRTMK